jgi:hypothetical protein
MICKKDSGVTKADVASSRGSRIQTSRSDRMRLGTDLPVHSQAYQNKVVRQLDERPRETLWFETPAVCAEFSPRPSRFTTLSQDEDLSGRSSTALGTS